MPALKLAERKALARAELQLGGEPGASRETIVSLLAQTRQICTCKPPIVPKSRRPKPRPLTRSPRPRNDVIYFCSKFWPGGYREAPRGASPAPNEVQISRIPPVDPRCYPPRGPAILDASNAATLAEARRLAILGHADPDKTQAEIASLLVAGERGRIPLDFMAARIAQLAAPPVGVLQAAAFRQAETWEQRTARHAATTTALLQPDPARLSAFRDTCGRTQYDWYCFTGWPGGFTPVKKGGPRPGPFNLLTRALPAWTERTTDPAGNPRVVTHTETPVKHPCCYPQDRSCDANTLGRWLQRQSTATGVISPRPPTFTIPGTITPIPLPPASAPAPAPPPSPGDSPTNCIHVTGLFERTYLGVDGRWYCVRGRL